MRIRAKKATWTRTRYLDPRAGLCISALALAGCFDSTFLAGLPCNSDADCANDFICTQGCCGSCETETKWCADKDSDKKGDPSDCVVLPFGQPGPSGTIDNEDDCDDSVGTTYIGAAWLDDVTQCMNDEDGDGWGSPHVSSPAVPGRDCDDTNPALYDCMGCDLLLDGGGEDGVAQWKRAVLSANGIECLSPDDPAEHAALFQALSGCELTDDGDISPHTGDYFFSLGGVCGTGGAKSSYLTCRIIPLPPELYATGDSSVTLNGYAQAYDEDNAGITLYLVDENNEIVPNPDCSTAGCPSQTDQRAWTHVSITAAVPQTARAAMVIMVGVRDKDAPDRNIYAYLDDLILYDESCPGSSE